MPRKAFWLFLPVAVVGITVIALVARGQSKTPAASTAVLVDQVDGAAVSHHTYEFPSYYPGTLTVRQGQVITWQWAANPNAAHTVTLISQSQYSLRGDMDLVPDADDGTHAQQTKWNPYMRVGCGNTPYYPGTPPCIFDGTTTVSSGYLAAPVDPKTGHLIPGHSLPSFTVKITAPPGFYTFTCLVHLGMTGYLIVTRPNQKPPSPQSLFQAGQQQYQKDLKVSLAFEASQRVGRQRQGAHATWTVQAGIPYSPTITGQINEMVPAMLRIKPGDSVTWVGEMHTVTFPAESGLIVFHQVCESPGHHDIPVTSVASGCQIETEVNPRAYDQSAPPGRPYTGGFYNSGALSISRLEGNTWSVTLPRAGTYHYDCLLHWGMDGTIIVR